MIGDASLINTNVGMITKTGIYWMDCSKMSSNQPVESGYGILEVYNIANTLLFQRYTLYNTGKVYIRSWYQGDWRGWFTN